MYSIPPTFQTLRLSAVILSVLGTEEIVLSQLLTGHCHLDAIQWMPIKSLCLIYCLLQVKNQRKRRFRGQSHISGKLGLQRSNDS